MRQICAEVIQFHRDVCLHSTCHCWYDLPWSQRCYEASQLGIIAVEGIRHLAKHMTITVLFAMRLFSA